MKFRYEDALRADLKLDHFMLHPGEFHVTARDSDLRYHVVQFGKRIGRTSPPFLRMLVVSDKLARYPAIRRQPKKPHVWFSGDAETLLAMNLVFSGVDFSLERSAVATMARQGRDAAGATLVSGTLKGAVWGSPREISAAASAARPPGTLLSFSWPDGPGGWRHKAFILN